LLNKFIFGLFLFFQTYSYALNPEEAIVKRIHSHLLICDYSSACEAAKAALKIYPDTQVVFETCIQAFAKSGDETLMQRTWKEYCSKFPGGSENRDILECMAWGVIENGFRSASPIIRTNSLIGALCGQDAKGVEILRLGLEDSSPLVRAICVQLASHLRDEKLQDVILRKCTKDCSWNVRLEAIKALGKMKVKAGKDFLVAILASDYSSAEEKAAAIEAIIAMWESADRSQLDYLCKSTRAGLRRLGCEVIVYCGDCRNLDLLLPLLEDAHPEVRTAALMALGFLRVKEWKGKPTSHFIEPLIENPHPYTAITALWAKTILENTDESKKWGRWLSHGNQDVRLYAAGALNATGLNGTEPSLQGFKDAQDPFVKMTLALGLLSRNQAITEACQALYEGLQKEKTRWMWEQTGSFKALSPSKASLKDVIPNYPEAVNHVTRLEVLNCLSMFRYPKAEAAIKVFLQQGNWGITGIASLMILSEGDETSIDLIKQLLADPDETVRIQAALVLSLWSSEEEPLDVLMKVYPNADRDTKIKILEAIGRVGSSSSIPFLVNAMQEPFQSFRIIAATALLASLYH
jgi:HEAT repeat protein